MKPEEILERVKEEGFYKVWEECSSAIKQRGKLVLPEERGEPHVVSEVIEKIRKALLDLGFTEVINPVFVDEIEVYKQYGPEAPIILDRIYYLAGIPRPDIGMGKDVEESIRKLVGVDPERLKDVLREYRKGKISSDDLIEELRKRLKVSEEKAIKLVEILADFFKFKPVPSSLTLRSHMTASWFVTLKKILEYRDPPLYLFSVDRVFRREQEEDESHLRSYHSASVVIVDDELGVESAKKVTLRIVEEIQKNLGVRFRGVKVVKKMETAKYYAKGKEWEVYANFKGKRYEIGTFGFYNPISLARYKIPHVVYNFGIGVERIAQIITEEKDVRRVVYWFEYPSFTDEEIARSVKVIEEPKTEFGKRVADVIVKSVERYKDEVGPFKKLVYQDERIKVYLLEPDEGKKLAGPATFNMVYVKDGSIVSTVKKVKGIFIGRYLDLIAKRIAAEVERGKRGMFKIRWVRGPSDVNLQVPPKLLKWIEERGKKVEILGPVFLDVLVEELC